MSIFSERLRELREQKGLSMFALAQQIGVSDAAICKWENATNEPKASYISLLAEYFEVSSDYLLGFESDLGLKKYSAPLKNAPPLLNPKEKELLEIFDSLAEEYQMQILEYARYFETRTNAQKKKNI